MPGRRDGAPVDGRGDVHHGRPGRRRAGRTVAAIVLAAGVAPSAAPAQAPVYVRVVDQRTGAIVTDLAAAEVVVREDGATRRVVDVRPANLPTRLVVLVDTSGSTTPAFDRVRDGLLRFVEHLPANQELSLLTLASPPRWVVTGSLDPGEFRAGVNRLAGADTPMRLLDGLVDAIDWVAGGTAGPVRPVIVVVTADGADASADPAGQYGRLMDHLRRGGVSLHALLLSTPAPGSLRRRMSVPEAIVRDATALAGGSYRSVYLGSRLDRPLEAIAARIRARNRELAQQHLVRFERPAGAVPGRLQVSVTRLGATYRVTTDGRLAGR